MWLFLSSRIRTWLLLAVALPILRFVLHRLVKLADRRPDSLAAKALHRTESVVNRLSRRRSKR